MTDYTKCRGCAYNEVANEVKDGLCGSCTLALQRHPDLINKFEEIANKYMVANGGYALAKNWGFVVGAIRLFSARRKTKVYRTVGAMRKSESSISSMSLS